MFASIARVRSHDNSDIPAGSIDEIFGAENMTSQCRIWLEFSTIQPSRSLMGAARKERRRAAQKGRACGPSQISDNGRVQSPAGVLPEKILAITRLSGIGVRQSAPQCTKRFIAPPPQNPDEVHTYTSKRCVQ